MNERDGQTPHDAIEAALWRLCIASCDKNQVQKLDPMPFHQETEIKLWRHDNGSRMGEEDYIIVL